MILQQLKQFFKEKDADAGWLTHCLKIVLSSFIGMLFWHFSQEDAAFWTVLSATFLVDMSIATTVRKRQITLISNGFLSAFLVFVMTCIAGYFWISLAWVFLTVFIIFMVSYLSPAHHKNGVFLAMLMLVTLNFPGGLQNALEYSFHVLLGMLIAYSVNFFLWPDMSKRCLAPGIRSKTIILRALRVAIATITVMLIAKFTGLTHYSWAALTVLIVSQTNLGASIRKSSQRFLGTLIGVGFGIVAAKYFLTTWPELKYITPLIIFFVWYCQLFSYTLSAFFVTLLVADVYFFTVTTNNFNEYIITRLIDTGLGISVGIAAELLLFRQSARPALRNHLTKFWQQMHALLASYFILTTNHPPDSQQEQENLLSHFNDMQADLGDLAFEPYRLSKRYRYSTRLMKAQKNLYQYLQKISLPEIFNADQYSIAQQQSLDDLWQILQMGLILLADPNRPRTKHEKNAPAFYEKLQTVTQRLNEQLKILREKNDSPNWQTIIELSMHLQKCFLTFQYYFK